MSIDYASIQKTATRLIAQFGRSATLIQRGAVSGPAWDPLVDEPAEIPITLVETSDTRSPGPDGLAPNLKSTFLVSFDTVGVPTKGDTILLGDLSYKVTGSKPLHPAGMTLLYEVYAEI